ncbi:hypothetical protein L1049_028448 [Liquidambar formosana]|uniref:FRIGIDA-like protein n=1 Tax=Liquidambar formosana TaxID=63359 RepID=A0AAP0RKS9_LIQFO
MNSNLSPLPATVKEEERTPPPPAWTACVKGEPQELTSMEPSNHQAQSAAAATPSSVSPEKEDGREPQFLKSVNELRSLSTVIHAFRRRWDELQKHLDFIQNTIDAWSKQTDSSPDQRQQKMAIMPATETPAPNIPNSANTHSHESEQKSLSNDTAKQSSRSELEYLCEMMCSRGLRKYIVSRISDAAKLREEAPAALKSAPRPAKLVLECIGRFFLQGSKAFSRDSPMIMARQASVLILEFFLLTGCTEIEPSVKEEAELAAIAWRKRLISEGGVSRASDIDARGLLLFVGSFGIPNVFRNEDLRDLIRLSNPKEIFDALRHSHVLLMRIPDIIEGMMKNGMNIEAVDIAYTFGVEDKFPPQTILASFLRESKEAWKRTKREAQGSPREMFYDDHSQNEANKKQLAALKSVMNCLEDHKIDPLKLLPGWQIKEKIITLEKDISELEKKMDEKVMQKRKAVEIETSKKLKTQEVKRSRFTANVSPLIPTSIIGLQEQWAAGRVDGNSSYTPINLMDGGLSGRVNSYHTTSSIPHGFGAGSLPDNILGTMSGSGCGVLSAGVGAGGMSAGTSGVLSTGSFSGVHSEVMVDKVGQVMNNNGPLYGWHGVGDAAFNDRLIGQSFAGQPASIGVDGSFRPSPSLEGFVGLPNPPSTDVANRSSASDLYQFADAVLEGESYYSSGSRRAGTVPPVLPAHRPSYMY